MGRGGFALRRKHPLLCRRPAAGASDIDYLEKDDWSFGDLSTRLHLEPRGLVFDADYVRGRLVKTTVTIGSNGGFVVETRNRHEMAVRWLRTLRGKKHIQLVEPSNPIRTDKDPYA